MNVHQTIWFNDTFQQAEAAKILDRNPPWIARYALHKPGSGNTSALTDGDVLMLALRSRLACLGVARFPYSNLREQIVVSWLSLNRCVALWDRDNP